MNFTVVQGDIAAQSADALVNAAGTSLRMGPGVAGALRRGGGPELNEAAMAKGPRDLGAVAVTDAFDLDAEVVIPALGCGIAGFDLADGARLICEELRAFEPSSLRDVRFIAYADDEFETISRVADAVGAATEE
ncbi:Appr-1-p processing protein [Haloferax sp. Atlit-10N]|uniref:macro domain-containing protein n=1 Tax=unclassified Haloferax TaxID=2625095 RepID=UPI000E25A1C7|nr:MULTISPECIES: macro domain-containing protein [unclassified Haloferax]RDZ46029.1 Appr-1-p processing protein [Haloferax sp. Atlit-19N]RDZ46699.1 Appr-1-p processing protein [Haloferax sp. Atlit-16N]RDZ60532.1 Appr-1-p processing protein [Haloferax sp. Atlit-10N]